MPGFGRVEPPADVGVARWLVTTEGVSKQMATISIERNTAVKSIVVRFCANAFIKNRQNGKLRMWFCVFTHPRPAAAGQAQIGNTLLSWKRHSFPYSLFCV